MTSASQPHRRRPDGAEGRSPAAHSPKLCDRCGRTVTWRRKWARCWDQVRYCSHACRQRRLNKVDQALEGVILELLQHGGRDRTICPSEAARRVGSNSDAVWRHLMEPARRAGRRLAARGVIEFTQNGRVVDPSRARGPVRLRLLRSA